MEEKYDENGKLSEKTQYDESGNVIKKVIYFYKGDRITSTMSRENQYEYDKNGKAIIMSDVTCSYDESGKLVSKYKTEYTYDGDNTTKETTYYYDENDNAIKSYETLYEYDKNGSIIEKSENIYDKHGRIIENKIYDEYGYMTKSGTKIEYNAEGNIEKRIRYVYGDYGEYYELDDKASEEIEYDYDEEEYDYDDDLIESHYHTLDDISSGINPKQSEIDEVMQEMVQERTVEKEKENKTVDDE